MMEGYLENYSTLPSKGRYLTDLISMATTANDGIDVTSYMNYIDQEEKFGAEEVWFIQGSKYEVPLERKIYEFRKCVDVKLYRNYVIISGDNHVMKVKREFNAVSSDLKLVGAGKMCKIRDTRNIAVIQTRKPNVVVISTKGHLNILYKISTSDLQYVDQYRLPAYNNICFLGVSKHENFCVAYTGSDYRGRPVELVDSVTRGARDPEERSTCPVYETKKTLFPAEVLMGTTCMDAFNDEEFIIGYRDGISSYECFKRSVKKTELFENWSKSLRLGVTSICCHRNKIYASIKRENRVMVLDRDGYTLFENIIPGSYVIKPQSLSVYDNTIAVSEYDRVIGVSKVYILELREQQNDCEWINGIRDRPC